ncbi:hypothetical protein AUK40_02760 [Candidatus Wirthbacteria bacterium CG2_30_54_11]|uniref:ACT domain-containing protein n=1 Tax=Candidatus Wirthbacteria bacterium CG2_30_54_11 TaxID=1817892 RepID=A0A1J5IZE6_9BACT|nr:MAG: hypothetical protein AUK40_02760 [Candidatus Wirthbacteria bacterium CG2_30_54_11]
MSVERITVFVSPELAHIIQVTRIIGEAGVNGVMMSITRLQMGDTIRLVVDDPIKAQTSLTDSGLLVKIDQLIAVEIDDVPGSMAHFLEAISKVNDTVGSIQVFPSGISRDKAIVLIESDQPSLHDAIATAGYRELAYTDLT